MKEPVRKRYAIKISAKGEERIREKMPLYGLPLRSLESALAFLTAYDSGIIEQDAGKILLFDSEPEFAQDTIEKFLFFSDGLAKQIQLEDEELFAWKNPDKTYLIRFDDTAMRLMARKVAEDEEDGEETPYQIYTSGYLVRSVLGAFAWTIGGDNRKHFEYCRVFAHHEDAAQVLEELSEICGDHIKILETGDTSDFNKRLREEGPAARKIAR